MNTNKPIITNFQYFFSLLLFGICIYLYLFVFIGNSSAQSKIPLVVAPARQTVALDAGNTENLQIKFFNETDSPISGNLKAVDFIVTGSDGAPILLEDQINDWIVLPYDRASIPAGEVLRVNFKVNVPKDAAAGGRYAAIIFEQTGQLTQTTSNEAASLVSPRIVGLVSIKVNGPITESAFINVFKLPKFLEFGSIPVYFEISNKGGYHINPNGQVTLTNWMGQEIERVTVDDKNIFPNAKRNYEVELGETWMFGKYRVDLMANYGEQGKTVSESAFVWVVPVTVIVIIIFSIIIAILVAYLISKKIKARQEELENKLEEEISEIEALKNKFKDKLPK